MLKTATATAALFAFNLVLANAAMAAGCASAADATALKTAVMQQELMVAALQCHEAGAYNRFVINYRSELQSSDATLKAFFVKRGGEHGEAGYDTFKTKAANLSGLEQARDAKAFCADAHALFAAAAGNSGSLAQFVESRSAPMDMGGICKESRPVLASAKVPVADKPVLVRVADAAPTAKVETADIAIAGVPSHSLAANPWGRGAPPRAVQPEARQDDEDMDDAGDQAQSAAADEDDLPPPRPRAYAIRDRRYDDDAPRYEPRAYGPPPGWYPPPRYRWYPRDRYYQW